MKIRLTQPNFVDMGLGLSLAKINVFHYRIFNIFVPIPPNTPLIKGGRDKNFTLYNTVIFPVPVLRAKLFSGYHFWKPNSFLVTNSQVPLLRTQFFSSYHFSATNYPQCIIVEYGHYNCKRLRDVLYPNLENLRCWQPVENCSKMTAQLTRGQFMYLTKNIMMYVRNKDL